MGFGLATLNGLHMVILLRKVCAVGLGEEHLLSLLSTGLPSFSFSSATPFLSLVCFTHDTSKHNFCVCKIPLPVLWFTDEFCFWASLVIYQPWKERRAMCYHSGYMLGIQ